MGVQELRACGPKLRPSSSVLLLTMHASCGDAAAAAAASIFLRVVVVVWFRFCLFVMIATFIRWR